MGHIADDKVGQRPDLGNGKLPGNHGTPIVGNKHYFGLSGGINQTRNVGQQMRQCIVFDQGWPGTLAVTAQIRRPGGVTQVGKHRQLVTPGKAAFRKTVQAKCQLVTCAALIHLEGQAIGLNKSGADTRIAQRRGASLGQIGG